MTTFLTRLDAGPGDGPTVAVKDLIDIAGEATTAASRAFGAPVATRDAAVITAIRANGGRIVGKTNLHELAFGGTGINAHTGTPINPLDPTRIPGGSSSGSAVAVATGEADVALGTDTGGSIRTPAACCGVVGLKTTYGRIPLDGVQPLAPSLDTVGPLAATVDGIITGMRLLEPDFSPATVPTRWGRFRMPGTAAAIEDAIEDALEHLVDDVDIVGIELPGWEGADNAGSTVAFAEAAEPDRGLGDADMRLHPGDHGDRSLQRRQGVRQVRLAGRVEMPLGQDLLGCQPVGKQRDRRPDRLGAMLGRADRNAQNPGRAGQSIHRRNHQITLRNRRYETGLGVEQKNETRLGGAEYVIELWNAQ